MVAAALFDDRKGFAEKPYVSLKEYEMSDITDKEIVWYYNIIRPSKENKKKLIEENPESALEVFAKFDDTTGLAMITSNKSLNKLLRKHAHIQLSEYIQAYEIIFGKMPVPPTHAEILELMKAGKIPLIGHSSGSYIHRDVPDRRGDEMSNAQEAAYRFLEDSE